MEKPSLGGPKERSECRLVCCSGVGRDEGELNPRERSERHLLRCSFVCELNHRGHQPALIEAGRVSLPRRSQAKAGPLTTDVPACGKSILSIQSIAVGWPKKSVFIGVHPWFKTELNPFKRF